MRIIFVLLIFSISLPGVAGDIEGISGTEMISANQAYDLALEKKIILLDIRSEQEWEKTGVATVAETLSMHQQSFLADLQQVVAAANGKPIALICATGGRTAWLQQELAKYGIKNILDVSEGMMGSWLGAGWLRAGLPVRQYQKPLSENSPSYSILESLTGRYKPGWKQ